MNTHFQKILVLRYINLISLAAILSILMLNVIGCQDVTVTPTPSDNFKFSVMSSSEISDNTNSLVLDTVKILIKDIKLNVAVSGDSANFKTGPYVLYLNLNTGVNTIGAGYIPAGYYDKIKFEVHKLSDNEPIPDPDFADGNLRFSVVVKGAFNGVRFTYKSDKSAKQKLNLPNALVVTETMSNITLQIKPYLWFFDSNNQFLDPINESNRSEIDNNIKENIKANFKAFKDNNFDGIPD